ncbi:MAG: hypothetical protein IT370_21510 [Deltaproteobacteria bacterium]|nr:hypothetical protein [Deltaproteobacteria bacterium]
MNAPMRLHETPGKNVGALASDGRRVVVCEVQGYTKVIGRRNGELYRLHAGEWTVDALIDADDLLLVGGRTGTLRAVGLVDGEPRPCPSLDGVDRVRSWSTSGELAARGVVAACFDGLLRTFDARHALIATLGSKDLREAFDVRGATVVVAYEQAPLRAYDCRTGELLHTSPHPPGARTLGVHLDASGLVTSSEDGTLCTYDAQLQPMRTARVPDCVGRLHADPRDGRVLHALAAEAALRLDRETLEVLDRAPIVSLHDALAVDGLGRLVGVEGGVESLDPLPPPLPPDPEVPDIESRYDRDATFDKDLPGLCATAVEVWQDGRRITVCSWYHEAGSRRGDMTVSRGSLDRVEGAIVHVAMDDGSRARFDLTTRRLL